MRGKTVVMLVLSFGVAFAMLSGSGIGAQMFGENPGGEETTRTFEDISNDSGVEEEDEGLSAEVAGDQEPTLVGVAISGGQFAAGLVGAVALLPSTLMGLGFPEYFARPIGRMAQIIAFIALIQFVRNGEFL